MFFDFGSPTSFPGPFRNSLPAPRSRGPARPPLTERATSGPQLDLNKLSPELREVLEGREETESAQRGQAVTSGPARGGRLGEREDSASALGPQATVPLRVHWPLRALRHPPPAPPGAHLPPPLAPPLPFPLPLPLLPLSLFQPLPPLPLSLSFISSTPPFLLPLPHPLPPSLPFLLPLPRARPPPLTSPPPPPPRPRVRWGDAKVTGRTEFRRGVLRVSDLRRRYGVSFRRGGIYWEVGGRHGDLGRAKEEMGPRLESDGAPGRVNAPELKGSKSEGCARRLGVEPPEPKVPEGRTRFPGGVPPPFRHLGRLLIRVLYYSGR